MNVTTFFGLDHEKGNNMFGEKHKDPRATQLGWRILRNKGDADEIQLTSDYATKSQNLVLGFESKNSSEDLEFGSAVYRLYRTIHGIPEGQSELSPNSALPFEATIDYLQGVSFDKGCYLGQELTARTFHTGVTRKRLFPIILRDSEIPKHESNNTKNNLFPEWLFETLDEKHEFPKTLESENFVLLADTNSPKGIVKTGKLFDGIGNVGFGMIRMEHLANPPENTILKYARTNESDQAKKSAEGESEKKEENATSTSTPKYVDLKGARVIRPHWWTAYLQKLDDELAGKQN